MKLQTGIPLQLKIIAFIFIASGLLTLSCILPILAASPHSGLNALEIVAAMFTLAFCAGTVCMGVGLLRLSPQSRYWALVAVWTIMGIIACLFILMFFTPTPGYQWQGQSLEMLPTAPFILLGAAIFALFYWKYCVLTHSKTRRLFDPLDY